MPNEIKHNLLKNVLDGVASNASEALQVYHPNPDDDDAQVHKYSRAQIHLFLRTRFGLLDFETVESQITDGAQDGGLDAYHIDDEAKKIYLIQSKYGAKPNTFTDKEVDWREFFKMELGRIVQGEPASSLGVEYSGKIKNFQKKIGSIPDFGRWTYTLIYLGNIPSIITNERLREISGEVCNEVEVLQGEDFYNQILVPYLKHDFYTKEDFSFKIRVNERNANRIRYDVELENGEIVNVQLFFVPTIEIAKMMAQYRNSVLRYNPRCYVGIKNVGVNADIRESVRSTEHNEFSLLNNGITIICKKVSYNDSSGKQGEASVVVANPQIVNGGQTAFTLAHLYETPDNQSVFDGKEVFTKFIVIPEGVNRNELIKKISEATNNQNPIKERDRSANDSALLNLQSELFNRYGIIFERKQGEFYDSIKKGLIDTESTLDSVTLMRLLFVHRGMVAKARSAGEKTLFKEYDLSDIDTEDLHTLICAFRSVESFEGQGARSQRERYKIDQWGNGLRYGQWAIIYAVYRLVDTAEDVSSVINLVASRWKDFESTVEQHEHNQDYVSDGFDYANYYKGKTIKQDLDLYLSRFNS